MSVSLWRNTLPDIPVAIEGPNWYLTRHKQDLGRLSNVFCAEKFIEAVELSWLNAGARRTMAALLDASNGEGLTTISGAVLAQRLQVRAATVSTHWNDARSAGLLVTRRRFNNSSIQQLAWPGSGLGMPNAAGTINQSHKWSDAELAWWTSLGGAIPLPPPWGDHGAPF